MLGQASGCHRERSLHFIYKCIDVILGEKKQKLRGTKIVADTL